MLARCGRDNDIMKIGWSKHPWFASDLVTNIIERGGGEVWIWIPEVSLLVVGGPVGKEVDTPSHS
jgi:hypothetical protein